MGTKLYVGNLSFNTTENELQELFAQAGTVQEVSLMQDKFTGKSRGFAFVTMGSDEDAQNAISKLNGQTVEGRPLTVNEARPRERDRPAVVVVVAAAMAAVVDTVAVAKVASEEATRNSHIGPVRFCNHGKLARGGRCSCAHS